MVTVYSQPGCRPCIFTKRALESAGVPYVEVDITESEEALKTVSELGYKQSPVVVTPEGDHWSGLRPDKISALVAA